jgi:ABC-2 type transport system permease protein
MNATMAIARRELFSFLVTPAGYLVSAIFLFFTALVYFAAAPLLMGSGFAQGQPASLRMFFDVGVWVFFIIGPAISMRAISEELRLGTIETLMTAPVSEGQVILGKFMGAFGFLVVMLLPTVVYVLVLERFGRPDYGELLCGYLGLLLIGSAYLATGILASTLTSSQVLAYITTIFLWLVLLIATMVLPYLASLVEGLAGRPDNSDVLDGLLAWFQSAAEFLAVGSPLARIRAFVNGLVDTFNVVFFVSFTVVFLVAATKALAARRCP